MLNYKVPYLSRGHLKLSFRHLVHNIKNSYKLVMLSIFFSFIILFLLLWVSNLSLLKFIMLSDLSLLSKLEVLYTTPKSLITSYEPIRAILIVAFSVLQGLNLALLIKVLRVMKRRAHVVAGNSVAIGITVVGAGCGACGTSLLTPVVASVGTGAFLTADVLGTLLMTIALFVTLYSIHRLSLMLISK